MVTPIIKAMQNSNKFTSRSQIRIPLVLVFVLTFLLKTSSPKSSSTNPASPKIVTWHGEAALTSPGIMLENNEITQDMDEDVNHKLENSETEDGIQKCSLPKSLVKEIASYQNITNTIINTVLNGTFKGRTYDDLGYFVDKYGPRLSGTANLENAIDFMLEKMRQDGLENVHGEKAIVPHWVRGEESARMILPRVKQIAILGLGFSIGTSPEGIKAEVLVVKSFDELKQKAAQAKGKIVVYNEKYVSYGITVEYRGSGASEAAKVGAVASLIRSVTPFSLGTLHTGMQDYQPNVTQIPTACITIEDAELFQRLQDRGWRIVVELKMTDFNLPLTTSRNSIGEIVGRESPNEVVVVSGHIDSWDVGQGAMDDGAGAMISEEALSLLTFLKLRPRRTLRAILWTAEELGLWGVQSYIKTHENEMDNFKAVFESDIGTFKPLGLDFSGVPEAGCIVQEVLKLFVPINATLFRSSPEVGSDIGYFIQKGVPGLSLNTENSQYFLYHHSEADTMTVENPGDLDLCTALWAASSYVLADLSESLPR